MKKILLLMVIILLYGCETKTTPQELTLKKSNVDYEITLLFEIDSVKVYRFYDGGRGVYFSNSQGRIDYDYTTRSGKITTHHSQTTLMNQQK